MTEILNDIPIFQPLPQVNISVSPEGATQSLVINYSPSGSSTTFSWPALTRPEDSAVTVPAAKYVAPSTELTFTATVTGLRGATVSRYHWRFGDGTEALGQTVTHTYKYTPASVDVHLEVVDSLGRSTYSGKVLNFSA